MTKTTSKLYAKTLATSLALGAIIATTGVSAAGVHILEDAITDYNGKDFVSSTTSSYDTDEVKTSYVLEQDYYDYSPRSLEKLEEAEFAAFEVPEELIVQD